jgi:hypothetical protein
MNDAILAWLGDAGAWAWQVGVILLVVVNVAAVAVVSVTRDRALVDRWTGRWLGFNLGLIGFAAGVPLLTGLLRLAFSALPTFGSTAAHLPK